MGQVEIEAENGKGAQRDSALTDCRVCSLLRSPGGGGPAHLRCKPPARLSLQFWDANPMSVWPMTLSSGRVALPLGDTLHSQNIGGFNDN